MSEKSYRLIEWPVWEDNDETYIYNKDTEETIILNKTAAAIYRECGKAVAKEIADRIYSSLEEENTVGAEEILKDVESVIDCFLEKGLIQTI